MPALAAIALQVVHGCALRKSGSAVLTSCLSAFFCYALLCRLLVEIFRWTDHPSRVSCLR